MVFPIAGSIGAVIAVFFASNILKNYRLLQG